EGGGVDGVVSVVVAVGWGVEPAAVGKRRWCCDSREVVHGSWVADKEAAVRVAAVVVVARYSDGERRVRESDMMGRIDRVTSNLFGFAEKIPPKKFSGGGRVVAGGG
nr:hypothetical protein [Tanacetum cinerariifolium]